MNCYDDRRTKQEAARDSRTEWGVAKEEAVLRLRRGAPYRAVDARVLGELAVHRSLHPSPWERIAIWDISHIPTGFSVARHLTEQNALKAVEALAGLDWNFEPGRCPAGDKKACSGNPGGISVKEDNVIMPGPLSRRESRQRLASGSERWSEHSKERT
jgi:hypothetical protein